MPIIHYVQPDGRQTDVDVRIGYTVMEGATSKNIAGIMADCGGAAACATCQVVIGDDWRELTGQPKATEAEMLEFAENAGPDTRLSCQIVVTAALDGLTVTIPARQG